MEREAEGRVSTGYHTVLTDKRCSTCGEASLMTIEIELTEPLAVEICSSCESRTWTRQGQPVPAEALFGVGGRQTILSQRQNRRQT